MVSGIVLSHAALFARLGSGSDRRDKYTSITIASGTRRIELNRDGENQAAIKHAARACERQKLTWIRGERAEVGDEQQELRADERADDDVDAEVEDPVRVEAARLRPHARELQPEEVRGGEQHA